MKSFTHRAEKHITEDPRWIAVVTRSGDADGSFYYAVKTTGIYCRPSCPARTPKPENVEFHASQADAEQAGFRPCKRCKPEQTDLSVQQTTKISEVCRYIERSEGEPTLDAMANLAGLSVYHFHRVFKKITGLTPKAYAKAHRGQRVRKALDADGTVTEAIITAGYNSTGRFYENSDQILGMTPSKYRDGGKGIDIHFAVGECSLGAILVASSERGICAISLGDDPEALVTELQDRFPKAILIGGDKEYELGIAQVIGFVESPAIGLDLPLDIRGTAFQQRVWQALREISAGTTQSYSDIAQKIGSPKAIRAVAGACAANTLAVAIPCHRVVRRDGSLSGYRWGIERKRQLLEREAMK